ncbi:DMT family transporter [Kineosporia sp. J2-2]|uniref:DMT family transporter n=1 Tax=Kineosporia corallincola TaxID=2835133 RepID=A0ABS5TKB3_9ACTN|nr:DMT family transporter [Kineosporia corallincola]MBT0771542.1 DMT family transporter [Kineosporia corallincola]
MVKPVLAAGVTVVLWASAFVGVRAAGLDYTPGALALGRLLAGSVALSLLVALRGGPRLPGRPVLLATMLWGAAWFGAYNLTLNGAERELDAGTTALLVNVAPVLVGVLAGLLLGEGFPPRLMAGLAVSFGGVVIIALTTSDRTGDLAGVLLGLASAVLYAGSATGQKRLLTRTDPLTLTWLGCLTGTVVCLPFAPALARQVQTAPASSTLPVLYLGVFPTAVAFLTWGYALSRVSVGRLAASTYLVPPLVVALSWALLGEVPAPLAFAGGALCLAGVGVATLRRRREPPAAQPVSPSAVTSR